MYQVVIVEDDPMISMLNTRFTEKDGRFHVIRTFEAGNAAWEYLRIHAVDLVILDVYMPQMSGLELLHRMRAAGVSAEVIMITAANDSETVESLLRLGVADFLVKPFSYERFRQALDNFCRRKEALRGGSVNQQNLDRLFVDAADPIAAPNLPAPRVCRPKHSSIFWNFCRTPTSNTPVSRFPSTSVCLPSPCAGMSITSSKSVGCSRKSITARAAVRALSTAGCNAKHPGRQIPLSMLRGIFDTQKSPCCVTP